MSDAERPPQAPVSDYPGTRTQERNHAYRELEQLQIALIDDVITESGYRRANGRIRRKYGLLGWGSTYRGP